jgi:DNA-binding CsgD family transcriptional regulator
VEELLAAGRIADDALPDRARRIVMARMIGMSAQTRRLIDAAALADAELTDVLLRAVVAETDIQPDSALREAVEGAVLVPDGPRYRFRHALLRHAVVETMMPGERRDWHLRWAVAIQDSGTELDRLTAAIATAHHWVAAGDPQRTLVTCLHAAALCRRQGATTEQAALLTNALRAWDAVTDAEVVAGMPRDVLIIQTAGALFDSLDLAGAQSLFEAELERPEVATDPLRQMLMRMRIAGAQAWQGGHSYDFDLDEAVRLARDAPASRTKVMVLHNLCWAVTSTDLELGRNLITEALEAAEKLADAEMVFHARVDRASQGCLLGLYREALEVHDDLRTFLSTEEPGTAGPVLVFMIYTPYALGDPGAARAEAETLLALLGSYAAAPFSWINVVGAYVEVLLALGAWDRARQVLQETRALTGPAIDPANQLLVASLGGLLAAWRGDIDLARWIATQTEPQPGTTYAMWDYPLWLRAEVALADRRPEDVRTMLLPVWTKPDLRAHAFTVYRLLVLAAHAEADLALAARVHRDKQKLTESEDVVRLLHGVWEMLPRTTPLDSAMRSQFMAEMGRWAGDDPAVDRWRTAEAAWHELGCPYDRAEALFRLAEALLDCGRPGDRVQAAESLGLCSAIARDLGATPLVEEATQLARRGRLTLPESVDPSLADPFETAATIQSAPTGGPKLTEREREVLALLIEGLSNSEIGKRLYMSPKTASVHVSRIITKLGAANRTQAATIGQRLHLADNGYNLD